MKTFLFSMYLCKRKLFKRGAQQAIFILLSKNVYSTGLPIGNHIDIQIKME